MRVMNIEVAVIIIKVALDVTVHINNLTQLSDIKGS